MSESLTTTFELTPVATTDPAVAPSVAAATTDPVCWVDEHGDFLFSYAMYRLRDQARSKDVVQETFLAALRNHRSFAGRSAERGWLLGILKHKIHDAIRKWSRETTFTDLGFYETEERQRFVESGWHRGAWAPGCGPQDWPENADADLERTEFWRAFHDCTGKLPRAIRHAFLMRELDGATTREICDTLQVKEANLWVMLHRARLALRRCLEVNWFSDAPMPRSREQGTKS